MTRLKIYSKPRGAGDQTSGGRGKLLRATTDLTRVQVLVRETLQNSWDAKLIDWIPAYGIHVHKPATEARAALTADVFTELPESLKSLSQSLNDPDMHVLEIYDRGTSGLDGPVRAEEAAPEGAPNNFNSFVFDIGTTKDDSSSGGTFGFGKTATFEVSHPHSVVYWSVCELESGSLEHRLIACSLHDPYDEKGSRFTGAHWWGDPKVDEIVPLRGDAARELGERLFETGFGEDETGTSILVIDPEVTVHSSEEGAAERVPVRTVEQREVLLGEITESLARDAWPKVITAGEDDPPMIIQIFVESDEIEISNDIRRNYAHYASSLTVIREALGQLSGDVERPALPILKQAEYPITLRPRQQDKHSRTAYFGDRNDNSVGYLHLMQAVSDDQARSSNAPKNRLCLMRSTAELVVSYEKIVETEINHVQWTGVFKPTPECDHHFASSEPPTHDSWTPNTADSEVSTYVVRQAMEAVKRRTRQFLDTVRAEPNAEKRSVRDVSNALSGFMPLQSREDSGDDSRSETSRTGARRKRVTHTPRVHVTDYYPAADGLTYVLSFRTSAESDRNLLLSAKPTARTADGRMTLEPEEYILRWTGQVASSDSGSSATYKSGATGELQITTKSQIAIELAFDVEEQS